MESLPEGDIRPLVHWYIGPLVVHWILPHVLGRFLGLACRFVIQKDDL
jgi:hypothetical protein